jgi:hypothetical protein
MRSIYQTPYIYKCKLKDIGIKDIVVFILDLFDLLTFIQQRKRKIY